MTRACDIIEALEAPAALFDADGRLTAANAEFAACTVDPALIFNLGPDARRDTLGPDGTLTAWRLTILEDGSRLATGQAVAQGLSQREHYLASLSHELRTPLTGVLGMADLLAQTRLAAEQRAYLAALQDCGGHVLGLVNDILDLARLDAGQLTLHPAPMEATRLLQSTAELLSPRAYAKRLEVAWTAPAGLPAVMADEGRLRQILFNLAGNAVKFTETGGVLLSVETEGATDGRARLRFVVADTGPGVAEDQRERIFEAFAQAEPGHGARGDSTGLGLAIVRRLAAAHGGEVGLDSSHAGGSRFWFEAEFPVAGPGRVTHELAGRAIAVISPNGVVQAAAKGLIEAAGGAALPFDCLDAAQGGRFEAVLIDHALAAAGGRRRRLKPLTGLPSVILLAPEERAHIARYRAAGFGGYLIKPLRDVSLTARLLAVLGEAEAQGGQPDERAAPESPTGLRVLLAEDNPINALLARALLEREGCVVERVADGTEALSAASASAYDLILMDLRMPGLGGRATTQALRARGVRTPIVALTADAFEEDRRACLDAGMDDFLSKPLDQAVLRAMLRRWTASDWTPAKTQAKLAS
jgi:signal transduction histidine kinase/CheY-like chemotaxis protein